MNGKERNRAIHADLDCFWIEFEAAANSVEKMELLKFYADKVYKYKTYKGIRGKRDRFNRNIHFKKLLNKSCSVCKKTPVIRHHIIQIQHGGGNMPKNIIPICDRCHCKVHPHLNFKNNGSQLLKEYLNVVG